MSSAYNYNGSYNDYNHFAQQQQQTPDHGGHPWNNRDAANAMKGPPGQSPHGANSAGGGQDAMQRGFYPGSNMYSREQQQHWQQQFSQQQQHPQHPVAEADYQEKIRRHYMGYPPAPSSGAPGQPAFPAANTPTGWTEAQAHQKDTAHSHALIHTLTRNE
eukprot:sb/3472861/